MNPFDMLQNHPFWASMTLAVLIWYSTITVYVAIRGSMDIKHMLRRLADQQNDAKADADRK
jgi:hypothetical protein